MVQPSAQFDQPVLALASRYPLLFQDLTQWVQANPQSTRLNPNAAPPAALRQGRSELLFNHRQPEGVLRRLRQTPGLSVVQFFPQIAEFLSFLTQPSAMECIQHPQWQPLLLLPLERAPHLQQWLLAMHPKNWPWSLLDARQFSDDATAQNAGSVGRQMLQFLQQICQAKGGELATRYQNRPTPAAILKDNQRPLRVLVFAFAGTAYQQFCARDLSDAFAGCGVEAQTVLARMSPARNYELLETIESFDPDVLLLNGRDRYDFPDLPRNLCVLSWDQDYVLTPDGGYAQRMAGRDLLMVMVEDWRSDAQSRGVPSSRLAHINLGANHKLYYPPQTPPPIEHDILFVGNIHPFDAYRKLIKFDELDEASQCLMLHARERLRDWVTARGEDEPFVIPDIDSFLRDCLAELQIRHVGADAHWHFLVNYFRYRVAHLLVRELYVASLTEFRLGLFGKGWDAFPALAPYAHPEIENGDPLREAIHRSAINLHLHTWTVHHPRLYDTAAAGGFLLVGRVPEAYPLDRVFTVGAEVDSFGSIGELKRNIRHYLAYPEQRQHMADQATRRARNEHTMEHRVADMKRFLCETDYDQR